MSQLAAQHIPTLLPLSCRLTNSTGPSPTRPTNSTGLRPTRPTRPGQRPTSIDLRLDTTEGDILTLCKINFMVNNRKKGWSILFTPHARLFCTAGTARQPGHAGHAVPAIPAANHLPPTGEVLSLNFMNS